MPFVHIAHTHIVHVWFWVHSKSADKLIKLSTLEFIIMWTKNLVASAPFIAVDGCQYYYINEPAYFEAGKHIIFDNGNSPV